MLKQRREVSSPKKDDRNISEFASTIQLNLLDLLDVAHSHIPVTSIPTENEGNAGDIKLVEDISVSPSIFYLYAKFRSGWKRITLS